MCSHFDQASIGAQPLYGQRWYITYDSTSPDQVLRGDLLPKVKSMAVEVVDTGIGLQAVGNHTQVPAERMLLSKAGGGQGRGGT